MGPEGAKGRDRGMTRIRERPLGDTEDDNASPQTFIQAAVACLRNTTRRLGNIMGCCPTHRLSQLAHFHNDITPRPPRVRMNSRELCGSFLQPKKEQAGNRKQRSKEDFLSSGGRM